MTTEVTKEVKATKSTKSAPKARLASLNPDKVIRDEELEILKESDGAYAAYVLKELSDLVQLARGGTDIETYGVIKTKIDELKAHIDPALAQLVEVQDKRYEQESIFYDGSTVREQGFV